MMKKKLTIFLTFIFVLLTAFYSTNITNRTNEYKFNLNSNETICFSVVGDFRENPEIAKKILYLAANDSRYVIITGDIATVPSKKSFKEFIQDLLEIKNKTNAIFFFVPGNHDVLRGYGLYMQHFGANNFIIALNFSDSVLYLMGLDNARGYFTDLNPLSIEGKKIIIAHYPIYDPYEKNCKFCNLVKQFKESDVELFIGSHVHGWYANVIEGILQVISAGGGAEFRDFGDEHEKYNYLKMCISGHEIILSLKDINQTTFWMKKLYW